MIKKIIFFLSLFLIIIFFLFVFFSRLDTSKKTLKTKTQPTIIPTLFINQKNKATRTYPQPTNHILITTQPTGINDKFYERKILPQLNSFTQDEIEKYTTFIQNIPILDKNYSIFYSPLFNKVYFKPKNTQGKKQIRELIKKYQLEKTINKFPQNFIIDENITEEKIRLEENNFLENQQKKLLDNYQKNPSSLTVKPFLTIAPSPQSEEQNSFDALVELLKILLQGAEFSQTNLENNHLSPSPSVFFPQSSPSLPQFKITSLTQLFNDVSQRVGVPVKILEGVLTIETPSTFNLTSDQIALYSQPGNRINNCAPNICSATGPMQMTIGIDNSGSNKCSKCGLNSCPNAWAAYGRAVNIFTNDTHTPDPCNLRDNIFAAAYKLKTDSKATDPLNWTQEQVYEAGRRYHGSCSDKYRYPYLGNRTYCEFLWWYYTNK